MLLFPFTGCRKAADSEYSKYSYEFFGVFDTLVEIIGYAKNEAQFRDWAEKAQSRFTQLHQLFDIYNDYPGLNNIKTVNEQAGLQPVSVARELIDLVLFSKKWYDVTHGKVNIALGPVLYLWHEARDAGLADVSSAKLPDMELLKAASLYTDIHKVIVDTDAGTLFLESGMRLDAGAVAKGYATELVALELQSAGMTSGIVSCGGNVRIIGSPLDGVRSKFGIGIQNPDGDPHDPDDESLDTVFAADTSLVTSGDYQRYYWVDGVMYHHLIDPATLLPANYYRAVTVMTRDSGLADFMSSAVFLLPYGESRRLVEEVGGMDALWIFADGHMEATDGMKAVLKKMGGASSR